jgi:hypothetical protein
MRWWLSLFDVRILASFIDFIGMYFFIIACRCFGNEYAGLTIYINDEKHLLISRVRTPRQNLLFEVTKGTVRDDFFFNAHAHERIDILTNRTVL